MQNPCSFSPFFLSLSKNYSKTIGEDDGYGVNWGALECSDTSALKGKTKQKNRRKSKRHAKENRTTG